MPLFPESADAPIPGLVMPGAPSVNGGGPHGDQSMGVVPGQSSALLQFLQNFTPGDQGVQGVSQDIVMSLPVQEWAWYSYYIELNAPVVLAGATDDFTGYTVPTNVRMLLEGINIVRAGGDNEIDRIYIIPPEAYAGEAGGNSMIPIRLAAGATNIFWPDNNNVQTYSDYLMPSVGPLLLEPGTTIGGKPDGTGVAATTFTFHITSRMTPLIRAATP